MKKLFTEAGKVYLHTALATVMCFIIYLSITTVFISAGTANIGYKTYEINEKGEKVITSEHYFTDGETVSYPEKDYIAIRSELSTPLRVVKDVISQAMMFALFVFFLYKPVSEIGGKDRTNVDYSGAKQDLWHGVKIGLLATVPSLALYLVLIYAYVNNINLLQIEYYGNYIFMPILQNITGGVKTLSEMPVWSFAALFFTRLVLPAVCGVLYILGFKKIILHDKFMYKKADRR